MQTYELIVQPFGSDQSKHVAVYAENRGRAFTAAALHHDDPDNVFKITLMREGERVLRGGDASACIASSATPVVCDDEEEWLYRIPSPDEVGRGSVYTVRMTTFDGTSVTAPVAAPRRPDAFTAAVVHSRTPDAIQMAWLACIDVVQEGRGRSVSFKDNLQYGGVVSDLAGSVREAPAGESAPDAGRAASCGTGTVAPPLPAEEERKEGDVRVLNFYFD